MATGQIFLLRLIGTKIKSQTCVTKGQILKQTNYVELTAMLNTNKQAYDAFE